MPEVHLDLCRCQDEGRAIAFRCAMNAPPDDGRAVPGSPAGALCVEVAEITARGMCDMGVAYKAAR